jgi:hypothetical protein
MSFTEREKLKFLRITLLKPQKMALLDTTEFDALGIYLLDDVLYITTYNNKRFVKLYKIDHDLKFYREAFVKTLELTDSLKKIRNACGGPC